MHTRGGVSRVRISQFADDEIGCWRVARSRINGSQPTVGNPELTGDFAFDFFCKYEVHPVTRGDEGSTTAVELAAMHSELAVDPLRLDNSAMEKNWRSSDAAHQQLQEPIRVWSMGMAHMMN